MKIDTIDVDKLKSDIKFFLLKLQTKLKKYYRQYDKLREKEANWLIEDFSVKKKLPGPGRPTKNFFF